MLGAMQGSRPRRVKPLAAALLAPSAAVALLAAPRADAQFGLYQLPQQNFVWTWGKPEGRTGFSDFDIDGGEEGFRCKLTAKIRFSSNLSRSDISDIENSLRTSLQFIYDVSNTMNNLDYQRELDWAQLSCQKPEAGPVDDKTKAEREARAREKTQRDVERRRARAQQHQDD